MKNQNLIKKIILSVILRKSVILFSLLSLLNYQLYSSFTPINYSYSKTDEEIAAENLLNSQDSQGAKDSYCEEEGLTGSACDSAWDRLVSSDNTSQEAKNLEADQVATAEGMKQGLSEVDGGGGSAIHLTLIFYFIASLAWVVFCWGVASIIAFAVMVTALMIYEWSTFENYNMEGQKALIAYTNVDQTTIDAQVAYFESMTDELIIAKTYIENKIKFWEITLAIGLIVVTILAILEAYYGWWNTGEYACKAIYATEYNPQLKTEYYAITQSSHINQPVLDLEYYELKSEPEITMERFQSSANKILSGMFMVLAINDVHAEDEQIDGEENKYFTWKWIWGFLGTIGPVAAIIIGSLATFKSTVGNNITRAVAFALVGAMLGITISSMKDVLAAVDERIDTIDGIKDSLDTKVDNETESSDSDVQNDSITDSSTSTVASATEEESDVIESDNCPSADKDGNTVSGPCPSESSKQFKSASSKAREVGGSGVNKALDIFEEKISDPASEGKVNTGGDASASEQTIGALKKLKRGLLNKLNDKLKSEGKKELDLDGEANKMLSDLKSSLGKGISKMSAKELANLNSISGFGVGGLLDSKKEEKGKDYDSERLNAKKKPAAPDYSSMYGMDSDLDLDGPGIGANQEELANFDADAESNKYEDAADDIVGNKGVSIFKVLSIRYKKSAYPKFFIKKSKAKN